MLHALKFVFLFLQDWRAQYRIELAYRYSRNHSTYINSHGTSYILSFEKKKKHKPKPKKTHLELLCRESCKISFKVNESSHNTVSDCQIQPMPFIFWLPFAYNLSIINMFFPLIIVKCKPLYALLVYICF